MFRVLPALVALVVLGLVAAPIAAAADLEDAVVREINRVRVERDLGRLRAHEGLAAAADRWSQAMASAGDLAHSLTLGDRLKAAAPNQEIWAENLAWMPLGGPVTTARRTVRAWLRSPPHRAVLLMGRLDLVGVGTMADGPYVYVTADFAGR